MLGDLGKRIAWVQALGVKVVETDRGMGYITKEQTEGAHKNRRTSRWVV